jgi:hypothetical protein
MMWLKNLKHMKMTHIFIGSVDEITDLISSSWCLFRPDL